MDFLRGFFGIAILIGVAWVFSSHRNKINWRLVFIGVVLQLAIGILVTKGPGVSDAFESVSRGFVTFLDFSKNGAAFLFGDLTNSTKLGFIFAFQVLPTILFFSTVSAGLYYLGILQKIVYGIAWVMSKSMGLSGPESLSAAGNIFLGQTEAPLLVRPYISKMTQSELMCLMTGGMATIAGGVLAAYVTFLGGDDAVLRAQFAAHLLSASVMNAPAGIVMAKILIPETEEEKLVRKLEVNKENIGANLIDALSNGASDGLKLAMNVGGMLLAFIALIALVNYMMKDVIGEILGLNPIIASYTEGQFSGFSLEYLLGEIFRIAAFCIGVEWKDTLYVGSLLGQKTVINEFVAYNSLSEIKAAGKISPKSIMIATYALCGFSNFSSIAIQIGGIGGMAPERQADLSRLGFKALLGASIACLMTATIAGMIYALG